MFGSIQYWHECCVAEGTYGSQLEDIMGKLVVLDHQRNFDIDRISYAALLRDAERIRENVSTLINDVYLSEIDPSDTDSPIH